MSIINAIMEFSNYTSLSGAEADFADYLCGLLSNYGLRAERDSYGNVFGYLSCMKKNKKTLLFEAHMDQIGLMVSRICDDGLLEFVPLGGVDQRILPGMNVVIHSMTKINGIIGACISSSKNEKEKRNLKIEEYRIETGLTKNEIVKLVSVGDFIQLEGEITPLKNGIISGPAMDNRVGIASILHCLQRLQKEEIAYNICVLFSAQEELGLRGAYTGLCEKEVDAAIVVDVTHGKTPDTKAEVGVFPLGCGAVICRGPNFHYEYTKQLIDLAKSKQIPYEIEVAAGESGTTAWAIQTANGGIPVMLASIPLRYMHTNVETMMCSDAVAVSDLLYHSARGGVVLAS